MMTDLTLLPQPGGDAALPIPAEPAAALSAPESSFHIEFAARVCCSRGELAQAMADAWDEARTAILGGTLAQALDEADLAAAAICRDQAADVAAGRCTPDRAVLETIRLLGGEPLTVWCGRRYADAIDLGGSMLQALRGTGSIPAHHDSLMMSGAASALADPAQQASLAALETRYAAPDCTLREKLLLLYMAGFLLCGVAAFTVEGETFYTVEQLAAWLERKAKRSTAAFTHACHRLLDEDHLLDPQLEAWLTAIGRRQDVMKWQAEIDAGML